MKTKDRVYEYIVQYIQEHGYSPTIRDICAGVGLKSTSSVQGYIVRLLDEGKLERDAPCGSPGTIRIPKNKN